MARTNSKYGRRTKLTKGLIDEAYKLIKKSGCTQADACVILGIGTSTWHRWINEAEQLTALIDTGAMQEEDLDDNQSLVREFWEAINQARIADKHERLARIKRAGQKSWQADAWYLERVYTAEYGRPHKDEQKNSNTQGDVFAEFVGAIKQAAVMAANPVPEDSDAE
jgi:hypothetical protein